MKKTITFGELLVRLNAPDHRRFIQSTSFEVHYGGSEANVALSLRKFGVDASFVTRLPDNEIAESALSFLHQHGVDTEATLFGGSRMGLYYLEKGALLRASKVIYDRAHSSFSELKPGMINWKAILKDAHHFHWSGITPALSYSLAAVCEEALKVASDMGILVSADCNFRANLWKYGKRPSEVMPHLLAYCDVVLGGKDDSELMLGIPVEKDEDLKSVFKKWKIRFPKLKSIASTVRNEATASGYLWQGVLWQNECLYTSKQYALTNIVDRVGAGDAYMAGIVYGLLQHSEDAQRTVDFATAAASLKHTIPGDVNLASLSEVLNVMKGDNGGRILR